MLGVFTLFFDTPQSSSGNAATMAISFADLLGTLIDHIKSTREPNARNCCGNANPLPTISMIRWRKR